jgi:peptidoglycan/LPS O-acetylase OafA/YrhL
MAQTLAGLSLHGWVFVVGTPIALFALGVFAAIRRRWRRNAKRLMAIMAILTVLAALAFIVYERQPVLYDWLYKVTHK